MGLPVVWLGTKKVGNDEEESDSVLFCPNVNLGLRGFSYPFIRMLYILSSPG